jgi:hypothetical protein
MPRKQSSYPEQEMYQEQCTGISTSLEGSHSTRNHNGESKIPKEYQRHNRVFSEEESQRLPQHTIWDHAIELLPGAPHTLPGRLLPLTQAEIAETHKFVLRNT